MCLWWNGDFWLDDLWLKNRPSYPLLLPNTLDSVPVSPFRVPNIISYQLPLILFFRYCRPQSCFWLRCLWLPVSVVVGGPFTPGKLSGQTLVGSYQIKTPVLLQLCLIGNESLLCIPCIWVHWVEGVFVGVSLGLMTVHLGIDNPLLWFSPLV